MAPTLAMFDGSMMMPEPIMFTVTMNVSCMTLIFFCSAMAVSPFGRFADHVGVEADAALHLFLEHALDLVVEAGEAVERFLEGEEVVAHRLGAVVPPLARNHH